MHPVISVVVPVFNVENYLSQCLESIRNQSFTSFECILIDDGSTDNSGKICDEYASADNRFRVFHISNSGRSSARNLGIEYSNGDYITFVDSDDYIDKNTFEKAKDKILNDKADICCYGMVRISDNERIEEIRIQDRGIIKNFIHNDVYMNSVCNKLFRRNIIVENNIRFALDLSVCEDLLFVFKAMSFSKSICYLDECFYLYRIIETAQKQSGYSDKELIDLKKSYTYLFEFCEQYNLSNKFRKFLKFREMYFAICYLIKPEFFAPNLYRANRSKFNYWTYSFRPDLFVITFFSAIHVDFPAQVYKSIKNNKANKNV